MGAGNARNLKRISDGSRGRFVRQVSGRFDKLVKSQNQDGRVKVKGSNSRHRKFRRVKRTCVRCSKHGIKHTAHGLFTTPSNFSVESCFYK